MALRVRRQRDGDRLQRACVLAQIVAQPYEDRKAPVALEDDARRRAADRRAERVLHGAETEAVTGDGGLIHLDVEHRQAGHLLHLHIGRARRRAQDRGDLIGGLQHGVEILAEDLDRDIAAHAREQLVEPQLDRLRKFIGVAGKLRDFRGDVLDQLCPSGDADRATRSRGFSMMKVSVRFGGIGSVAISAVPVLEKT